MENALVVNDKTNALEIFTGNPADLDSILNKIKEEAESYVFDVETDQGRKDIASICYKIARSKTTLDKLGKELVTDWKRKSKVVDASRKKARDFLDDLKAEIRHPLTGWEAAEAARIEAEKLAKEKADAEIEAHQEHELFLRAKEIERKEAEIAKAEAEKREKEAAEAAERERIEREKKIAEQAAEREREKTREAERKRIAAEERAKIEAEQAEIEKNRAVEAAKEEAEREARRKEAERIAREEEKRLERERLEADKRNRERVHGEIFTDLASFGVADGGRIVDLITTGKIRHLKIDYAGSNNAKEAIDHDFKF